jgi:signal transduction histidine kinase
MACPVEIPSGIYSDRNVEPLLRNLRDYIGLHTPVRNENGDIVDLTLVWWNDAYEGIRIHPTVLGQSMMATYFEPEGVLEIVEQVFQQGTVKQIFSIGENAQDRYRTPEVLVRIEVTWMQVGDAIVEIGSDLSQMTALELDLIAQRKAYTDATRQATLEVERSRIARDLHDSIIQNLFAIGLNLKTREDKDWAINSLNDVIAEIRSTIFGIAPDSRPPLKDSVEKIVDMFSGAWPSPPTLHFHLERELPDDLVTDIENVIREGLSNAARHAKASHVEVSVSVTAEDITVLITDDGIGPQGAQRRRGGGTFSLDHRATVRGGQHRLTPGSTSGSILSWTCPIH